MIGPLESSAFGAALVFGFRHGFDWDHLAALTDLTGSQSRPRRSMWLATLYALGHAAMVVVLGVAAILFAERVPAAADFAMERLVGASLIALGIWIVWTAVRTRGAPPLRSRWMLLIGAAKRLLERHRQAEEVVIEHSHPHDHVHPLHGHSHEDLEPRRATSEPARAKVVTAHNHVHRHVAIAPTDPFLDYGNWTSFGVGALHGIGAETPTQVLVFAAAVNTSGRPTSLAILLCFVIGLVASNTLIAATSTLGFSRVIKRRVVMIVLAGVTAAFSLAVGTLLLLGRSSSLS